MQNMPAQHDESRLLDETTMRNVIETVKAFCDPHGKLRVLVGSFWGSGQRWARNHASMTDDQRNTTVLIGRQLKGGPYGVMTNQIDEASLRGAVDLVTYYAQLGSESLEEELMLEIPHWEVKGTPLWSDATFQRSPNENGQLVHAITDRAERQGLLSAGYIESLAANVATYERDEWGREEWRDGHMTAAQCSATVRHPKGIGSGWAGFSSFDFKRIDIVKLADLAFDKCMKSLDPVRIEPGRYQTILEPQAVAAFVEVLARFLERESSEAYRPPFYLELDKTLSRTRSKLGLQVIDRRLSLYHDPEDPISGTYPSEGVRKVQWIKDGVLTELNTDYRYASRELTRMDISLSRTSFVLSGSETTPVDEMIRNTKRGLLVTRISRPAILDGESLLCTGMTRDGLWLIENGKITKAVRNFRWTESPLFILNNVESIGTATPVFTPNKRVMPFNFGNFQNVLTTNVAPTLQVNDFSFTSTIDAI